MLDVEGLVKHFPARGSAFEVRGDAVRGDAPVVHAVDGISFQIDRGETLALVGESGCGKTTTGRLVLRLLDPTAGAIRFEGTEVQGLNPRQLRDFRQRVQIVFQDPLGSFDPRRRVGDSVVEPLVAQGRRSEAATRTPALFEMVGLDPSVATRYPHEFSGGQRQRLAIARALSVQPDLVVLDEPVSALDVSIQAQVLNLLGDLRSQFGLAYLFISHDLAVVRHVADRIAVMHLGEIVETGTAADVYSCPRHPYTQALLSAVPDPDPNIERARQRIVLTGEVPSPLDPPSGCRFHTRCWQAIDRCTGESPELAERGTGHAVACHLVGAE
jgi:oligopeptide/dipeptide ABC transporter ATP-binding protein